MIISNIYQCSQSGTVRDEHDDDEPVNYEETGTIGDELDYDEPVSYEETGTVPDEHDYDEPVNYEESPLALLVDTLVIIFLFTSLLFIFVYS